MTAENEKCEKRAISEENHTKARDVDIYPQRKENIKSRSWYEKLLLIEKSENISKTKCEINIVECVKNSPIIKLMLNALKSSGCVYYRVDRNLCAIAHSKHQSQLNIDVWRRILRDNLIEPFVLYSNDDSEFDISRHVSCDICDTSVSGGYDPEFNQVVICHNVCTTQSEVQSTLTHELIHMFDYCCNKMDFNNLDHLACTEIRAANQCHCSFLGAMYRGTASPLHIKKAHQDCVIDKAVRSVLAVKQVSKDEATAAVMRVFDKCYNDLEPIGRRIRRNSNDMDKAYFEGPYYGYSQ